MQRLVEMLDGELCVLQIVRTEEGCPFIVKTENFLEDFSCRHFACCTVGRSVSLVVVCLALFVSFSSFNAPRWRREDAEELSEVEDDDVEVV